MLCITSLSLAVRVEKPSEAVSHAPRKSTVYWHKLFENRVGPQTESLSPRQVDGFNIGTATQLLE